MHRGAPADRVRNLTPGRRKRSITNGTHLCSIRGRTIISDVRRLPIVVVTLLVIALLCVAAAAARRRGDCTFGAQWTAASQSGSGATSAPTGSYVSFARPNAAPRTVTVLCRWLKPSGKLVCGAQAGRTRHWLSLLDHGRARTLTANPTNLPFGRARQLADKSSWLSLTGIRCDVTPQALTCGSLFTHHGFAIAADGRTTTF